MWARGWRDEVWDRLPGPWDIIIIGGGITGAGILREATRAGFRALLLESADFAAGTSSRSSKLVHGGFRYLKNLQFRITLESVRERELLLKQGRGLIDPLSFLLINLEEDSIPPWVFGIGLAIYDLMGLQWGHRHLEPDQLHQLEPRLTSQGLTSGYRYFDANTDDSRLVLRVMREAVRDGAVALNYAKVDTLLRDRSGNVAGVRLHDQSTQPSDRGAEVFAPAVINATGAWADGLRSERYRQRRRLRHLKGSHLFFPRDKLPINRAVSFLHPEDGRPVFASPWEGITLFGTTDVDHGPHLPVDPVISPEEVDYLLTGLKRVFPDCDLSEADVRSTLSGIRAVVDTGKADPSKESREHVLWREEGLLTVTGGKLTTFRVTAHDALRRVRGRIRDRIPGRMILHRRLRVMDPVDPTSSTLEALDPNLRLRILGRYGAEASDLVRAAGAEEMSPISDSTTLWAELRWGARAEGVVHLEDLMLRRSRLGITLPEGGLPWMDRIREIVQPELGWDDSRWEEEAASYKELWQEHYYLPDREAAQ